MSELDPKVLSALVLALVSVVGYLLRQKDVEQSKQIQLLFRKHDDDVERLAALELRIAQDHYRKIDLDPKFDRLERSIRESGAELGAKFDALSAALLRHIEKEDSRL